MKFYSETRIFINRTPTSIPMEDREARTEKHEISEAAYRFAIDTLYAGCTPLKNSDNSISFATILNSNESTETTFWAEA